MIISFEGSMGQSKTTAAIAFALREQKEYGKKIISNVHLNIVPYTQFSLEYFLENLTNTELEDCVLLLDEMYQLQDSRRSATKLNIVMSYFIVQTRKRGVDLYICTHHIENIDIRTRRAVDIRGSCRYYAEDPCRACTCKVCHGRKKINGQDCPACHGIGGTGVGRDGKPCERCAGYGTNGYSRVNFLDRRLRRRYTSEDIMGAPIHGPEYWPYFDTKERIPLQAKLLSGIDISEVV